MAQPVYSVWLAKSKDAYYKLSHEERNKLFAKVMQALKEVGGETLIFCNSAWSSENYQNWGVEKFPDIEAVQKHAQLLSELDWFNYIESTSYLGTELPLG